MDLISPAFHNGGSIPTRFTCEGGDISPPLSWNKIPRGTKSLVLTLRDPDAPDPKAPKMIWIHWIVYNIPPTQTKFAEHITNLPKPAEAGLNSWHKPVYGGPCPPIGRHRYFFELTALDTQLTGLNHPSLDQLRAAMNSHVLESTELMGTYEKHKK